MIARIIACLLVPCLTIDGSMAMAAQPSRAVSLKAAFTVDLCAQALSPAVQNIHPFILNRSASGRTPKLLKAAKVRGPSKEEKALAKRWAEMSSLLQDMFGLISAMSGRASHLVSLEILRNESPMVGADFQRQLDALIQQGLVYFYEARNSKTLRIEPKGILLKKYIGYGDTSQPLHKRVSEMQKQSGLNTQMFNAAFSSLLGVEVKFFGHLLEKFIAGNAQLSPQAQERIRKILERPDLLKRLQLFAKTSVGSEKAGSIKIIWVIGPETQKECFALGGATNVAGLLPRLRYWAQKYEMPRRVALFNDRGRILANYAIQRLRPPATDFAQVKLSDPILPTDRFRIVEKASAPVTASRNKTLKAV
jgi:hypothetical protein